MPEPPPRRITLGPVLFNWPAEQWRDFYFRIADEAPVDVVYIGEAVCSKRTPFFAPFLADVVERLAASGKEVVISTLALIMNRREMTSLRELAKNADYPLEANDISACALLAGKPHVVGPFVNVFNEDTLQFLAARGAVRVCLPVELHAGAIGILARTGLAEIEVQVFGRLPLALSARCYHARSHGLSKDSCQYVCGRDADGLALDTLDGQPFLAVNGVQTLSHSYANLAAECGVLNHMGVSHFRLWPQSCDMVAVAQLFHDVLDGKTAMEEADACLARIVGDVPFANGYYHGVEGVAFSGAE